MFLSFIVPVYNVEKYLGECLDSLLDQDIDQSDYEIVCVNDGSTDGSPEILAGYAQRHPNIRVVTKENGGLPAARNTGVDHSRGDYIWHVDSDDFVQRNVLGQIRALTERTGCDRVSVLAYEFTEQLSEAEREAAANRTIQANANHRNITVWNNVFKRAHLEKHGLRSDEQLQYGEDVVYMLRFSAIECLEEKFDQVCYFYRKRAQSITSTMSLKSQMMKIDCSRIVQAYYLDYHAKGLGDPVYIANRTMGNLWHMLYMTAQLPGRQRREVMRQLKKDKLFPYDRLEACTIWKSYCTDRTDLIGKIFERLYLNMHRPWAFRGMVVFMKLVQLKNKCTKEGEAWY